VTGIGSLPFTDPEQALSFIAETAPEIPYWPQLPQRCEEEMMLLQPLGIANKLLQYDAKHFQINIKKADLPSFLEGINQSEIPLLPRQASGFFAFEKALEENRFPKAKAIKAQMVGPLTLAQHLFVEGRSFNEDPRTRVSLSRFLLQCAKWQVERLKKFGLPILYFVDEPSIQPEKAKYLHGFFENLKSLGVTTGLHSCRKIPYEVLLQFKPDIFSFDADKELEDFCQDPSAKDFIHNGGKVAWGIVPTDKNLPTEKEIGERFQKATREFDKQFLLKNSLFTPACGLALQTIESTQARFNLTIKLKYRL